MRQGFRQMNRNLMLRLFYVEYDGIIYRDGAEGVPAASIPHFVILGTGEIEAYLNFDRLKIYHLQESAV
jgi:hypothetical protein